MPDVRPAPWSASPPDGCEWVPKVDPDWKIIAGGDWPGGRCRSGGGMSHRACGKPAVAAFNRGRRGGGNWWAYCSDHMYSRWIENGQVLVWSWREVAS